MLGFFKRKKDENNEDNWNILQSMSLDKKPNTEFETQDINDQKHVVSEVEKLLDSLPPHVRRAVEPLLVSAHSALALGQKVPHSIMSQINQTLNNEQVKSMLQATFGGIVLACSAAPEATLGTSAKHGLDSLAFARPVGRTLLGAMAI